MMMFRIFDENGIAKIRPASGDKITSGKRAEKAQAAVDVCLKCSKVKCSGSRECFLRMQNKVDCKG